MSLQTPVFPASPSPASSLREIESSPAVAVSPFRATTRCELRLARWDLGWWMAVVLMLACAGYALETGRVRLNERARGIAEDQRDETERLATLTKQLDQIEQKKIPPPREPFRDPRNAIYVGRGQGAAVAYLPNSALAAAAVGVSDLYPPSFKVSANSKDSFLFVDEIANPAQLLNGEFDLAFVIVYIYPLLLLALSYNILSGEREQGTLPLIAASSAPLLTVLAGKLLVRAGGLTAVAVAGIWVQSFAIAGQRLLTAEGLAALMLLTLTIGVYGAFWIALALWVNSLRRDSAYNAIALVMAWVALLLAAPAAMNAAAQTLYPAPARAEMVLAARGAAIDAERDRDAAEARYWELHPNFRDAKAEGVINDPRSKQTLAAILAADVRSDAVLADHDARVQAQRRLSDRLAFFTPPALINDAIAELAGNGHTRWDDFLARVDDFHSRWQEFFVERARREAALTAADYERFPRFDASDLQKSGLAASAGGVALKLAWVGVLAAVFGVAASRRLSRPA